MTSDLHQTGIHREVLLPRAPFCSRSLQTVARVASTRSAIQALSGVQLAAEAGGVELRATDMEVGLRVPLDGRGRARGHGRAAGAAAARRRPLAAGRAASRSSCAPPSRTSRSSSGSATFHLRTLRAEDFPPLPEPGGDARRRASRPRAFVETIARVARSASRDETRPILTGILVSAVRRRSCGWSRPTPTA